MRGGDLLFSLMVASLVVMAIVWVVVSAPNGASTARPAVCADREPHYRLMMIGKTLIPLRDCHKWESAR